jgi:predicted Fe-Mo cluster-binding NifX family protein
MIAALLPDEIPKANYHKFLKLKAQDTALPGSLAEQLHKKYEETRDQIVSKLPKKLQKLAKEGMDLAVEKGVSYAADQALKAAGLPSDVEEGMKKVVDDYLKQVVEGESKEDK